MKRKKDISAGGASNNSLVGADSRMILFKTDDEQVSVDVLFAEETVWLTQEHMGLLFQKSKSTISEHISNIFKEGELNQVSVVRKFRTTAADGKSYDTNFYNLDVIISVGYRVKSLRGTQFRQWATKRLNEYIRKGFTIDDEIGLIMSNSPQSNPSNSRGLDLMESNSTKSMEQSERLLELNKISIQQMKVLEGVEERRLVK
ncbi:MAG: virulence RhuM family protein [Bacteroidales bacterium]|nr:virulence RhuM family protein [Bacteroidales bacterium]